MRLGVYPLHDSYDIPAFKTIGAACFDLSANLKHVPLEGIKTNALVDYDPSEHDFIPFGAIWDGVSQENFDNIEEAFENPDFTYFETVKNVVYFVPTGLIFDIPEGHYLQVSLRSGFATKYGAYMPNGVGIIDSDYTDELLVPVIFNKAGLEVYSGDRIAQAILKRKETYDIVGIPEKPEQKTNRVGGFGSTGDR